MRLPGTGKFITLFMLRMSIKQQEIRFIAFVLAHDGRIPPDLWAGLTKLEYSYLKKWADKDWWDYGVSARSGWVTHKGREALQERFTQATSRERLK